LTASPVADMVTGILLPDAVVKYSPVSTF